MLYDYSTKYRGHYIKIQAMDRDEFGWFDFRVMCFVLDWDYIKKTHRFDLPLYIGTTKIEFRKCIDDMIDNGTIYNYKLSPCNYEDRYNPFSTAFNNLFITKSIL